MFCKHCGTKLTGSERVCPNCKQAVQTTFVPHAAPARAKPREEELMRLLEELPAAVEYAKAPEKEQEGAVQQDELPDPDELEELEALIEPEAPEEPLTDEEDAQNAAFGEKRPSVREINADRRSRTALTLIVCLCAAILLGFTALRLTTNLFDAGSVNTVALSSLTEEEKQSFLSFFEPYTVLCGKEFNKDTMGISSFFDLLEVGSADGLFARSFSDLPTETQTADPANRFSNGEDGYGYVKVDQTRMNELAGSLGVSLPGSINSRDLYFYDGAYYARAASSTGSFAKRSLTVSKSRRTQEGDYYIALADEATGEDVAFCLASCDKTQQTPRWVLSELSASALFQEDGTKITAEKDALLYEMRQETISAKTSGGVVYANYVLNYPYFKDTQNETAVTINALYAQILTSYREKAQQADDAYARYVKRGYDETLLPAYTYLVSSVTYNKNGYIGLLDELTEYEPETTAKELKKAAEASGAQTIEREPFVFPTVTYSGTTVSTVTGAFMRKDDFFTEEAQVYEDAIAALPALKQITSEEERLDRAQKIYASPWVLTGDGVRFCWQNPEGFYEYPVLPFSYLEGTF